MPMVGTWATCFFKPLCISAADSQSAESRALNVVAAEWRGVSYAAINQGDPPHLTIDSISRSPWWSRFLWRKRGYVFAPDEDPNAV